MDSFVDPSRNADGSQNVFRRDLRPFSLMMGVRKRAFRGVFIEENAHRSRSPCLHLQGKWSSARLILATLARRHSASWIAA